MGTKPKKGVATKGKKVVTKTKTIVKKKESSLLDKARGFAEVLGVKIEKAEDLVKNTLAAINKEYVSQLDELSRQKFEDWKEANRSMIDFYMANYKNFKFDKNIPKPAKMDAKSKKVKQVATKDIKKVIKVKSEKAKKGSKDVAKDKFGFPKGSMRSLFVAYIEKLPRTMKECKEASWNTNGSTYYKAFKLLKSQGLADLNKDDKMLIVVKKKK